MWLIISGLFRRRSIIKTKDNHHVFLEVNPGGQFGMVSHPCNYHLERKMAMALINLDKSNEN